MRDAQVLKDFTSKSSAFAFWSLFLTPTLWAFTAKMSNLYAVSVRSGRRVAPENFWRF